MAVSPFDYEDRLAACARGDQAALQELYAREAPHMLALCIKMLSQRDDAEEVVRDIFVLIWKNAANYDPEIGTARAWIYSIMRYRILNRLRQSGRPDPADADWIDTLPDGLAAENGTASSRTMQILAQLDEHQRRPILMAFYNGFTYDQIANRLAIPAAEVKANVRSGLRALEENEPV